MGQPRLQVQAFSSVCPALTGARGALRRRRPRPLWGRSVCRARRGRKRERKDREGERRGERATIGLQANSSDA